MTRPRRRRIEGELERLRAMAPGARVSGRPDVGRADGLAQDLDHAMRRVLGRPAAGDDDRGRRRGSCAG